MVHNTGCKKGYLTYFLSSFTSHNLKTHYLLSLWIVICGVCYVVKKKIAWVVFGAQRDSSFHYWLSSFDTSDLSRAIHTVNIDEFVMAYPQVQSIGLDEERGLLFLAGTYVCLLFFLFHFLLLSRSSLVLLLFAFSYHTICCCCYHYLKLSLSLSLPFMSSSLSSLPRAALLLLPPT